MEDDILLDKINIVERCIKRIQDEYIGYEDELVTNYTKQDAIILNLQRACEAIIDMGLRIIRLKHLDLPQSARDIFAILEREGIIAADLSKKLQAMVGFRNIAVHDYTNLNLDIVKTILEENLDDLVNFNTVILHIKF